MLILLLLVNTTILFAYILYTGNNDGDYVKNFKICIIEKSLNILRFINLNNVKHSSQFIIFFVTI